MHAKKAKIVDSRAHDLDIIGKGCALSGSAEMRCQHERGIVPKRFKDLIKPRKDLDVGIKIEDVS